MILKLRVVIFCALIYGSQQFLKTNILSNILSTSDDLIKRVTEFVGYNPALIEDAYLDVPHLVAKYGYPVENHTVITPDGYILTMHRIPHGRKQEPSLNKTVMFLQHGFMGSSADWLIMGPDFSFGYILADAGFDVWMGNSRGNRYGRANTQMTPNMPSFWDFSWHEMGMYDLPTCVDYILTNTNQKSIFHAGHSQGTTSLYIMLSELPKYNPKIRAHFSLSPIAYMSHTTSPVMALMGVATNLLRPMLSLVGYNEWLPSSRFLQLAGGAFCKVDALAQLLCSNILFVMFGFHREQINTTMLPALFGHVPAGASTNQVVHFGQLMTSGRFQQYDHGFIDNLKLYGNLKPPEYQTMNIKAPIFLFYGLNDWVAHELDVISLYNDLKNRQKITIPDPNWNHLDYLYAIDARKWLYPKIMQMMQNMMH